MILYFDTETTGLYPGSICQLSYVMQTKNGVSAKNKFFTVAHVDYGAYMVHGFSVEKLLKLSGGKRFSDAFDEINEDFIRADAVVAHNCAFDFSFMRAEYERLGKIFAVKKEFCSMKTSVSVCKLAKTRGAGYKYPKLYELCEHFGITENDVRECAGDLFGKTTVGFHDARFDTAALYLATTNGMKRDDVFGELNDYSD